MSEVAQVLLGSKVEKLCEEIKFDFSPPKVPPRPKK